MSILRNEESAGPVRLALWDPMPSPTQNMFYVFKIWKFSAQCPHPIGVMVPARVSILGPPSRKSTASLVCTPTHAQAQGQVLREDADGAWLYYLGSESTSPCKDLVGLSGTKGGKRKVQEGASFSSASSSSPGHGASSGRTWSSDHCEGVCGDAE